MFNITTDNDQNSLITSLNEMALDEKIVKFDNNSISFFRTNADYNLSEIFAAIPAHVESLDLSYNSMETFSVEELSALFAQLPRHISSINLNFNNLSFNFDAFYQAVQKLPPKLQTLILGNNDLHFIKTEKLTALFRNLPESVSVIDLNGCLPLRYRDAFQELLPDNYTICEIIEGEEGDTLDEQIEEHNFRNKRIQQKEIQDYLARNALVAAYPIAFKKPFGDLLYAVRGLEPDQQQEIAKHLNVLFNACKTPESLDDALTIFKDSCYDTFDYVDSPGVMDAVLNVITSVIVGAITTMLCIGIGFGIGFAAGIWMGPGAFITALMGGSAAAIAVTASSASVGAVSAAVIAVGLFSRPKEVTAVKKTAELIKDLSKGLGFGIEENPDPSEFEITDPAI